MPTAEARAGAMQAHARITGNGMHSRQGEERRGPVHMVDDMRSTASVDEKYEADDELPTTGSDLCIVNRTVNPHRCRPVFVITTA